MLIKEYWQECIQEIREFKYLDQAMNPEFEVINQDTSRITEDILVLTAPESILSRYEKILDLEVEQDIDVRRRNILNKLSNRSPFTKWWLVDKLNTLLGKGNYTVNVFGKKFEIVIEVDIAFGHIFSSVQEQFLKQIPANMLLIPKLKITAGVGAGVISKTCRFYSPTCEYITGIYPYISSVGKVAYHLSQMGQNVSNYLFESDVAGIKPDISTLGKIAYEEAQTMETRDITPFSYKLCNTIMCGM